MTSCRGGTMQPEDEFWDIAEDLEQQTPTGVWSVWSGQCGHCGGEYSGGGAECS